MCSVTGGCRVVLAIARGLARQQLDGNELALCGSRHSQPARRSAPDPEEDPSVKKVPSSMPRVRRVRPDAEAAARWPSSCLPTVAARLRAGSCPADAISTCSSLIFAKASDLRAELSHASDAQMGRPRAGSWADLLTVSLVCQLITVNASLTGACRRPQTCHQVLSGGSGEYAGERRPW